MSLSDLVKAAKEISEIRKDFNDLKPLIKELIEELRRLNNNLERLKP
jgi:predicted  nucleic acid-binding Zn-ribbon protein